MLFTCEGCGVRACVTGEGTAPEHCPIRMPGYSEKVSAVYAKNKNAALESASQRVCGAKTDRDRIPRLKIVIEYCRKMGYKKIGIAFCAMVFEEMDWYSRMLRKNGFEVVSACWAVVSEPESFFLIS